MPIAIVPPGRNASAAALQKIFEDTQDKLIREILRKRSKGYVDYAEVAALERVRKTLHKMVKGAEKYVPMAVEHEFYNRPESLQAYANARASINPGRTRAVEILSDNLMGEIEEMAETAYQSTASKLFLVGRAQEDIFREAGLTKAIEASAAGRGSLTTVNEIIAAIQNTGITAFVDKAGHEWNLKAYGSMAVRTTVRQAQVAAVLTENEHDLYKIINTGVPCRWCAAYGGRVYSKSGMNKNYPPLTAAFGRIDTSGSDSIYNSFLNIHPNCMCTLVEYHEEDHSPEEVEKERLFSDPARRPFDLDYRTKAVKEAYEQKERNRAVYRANVKQYRRYLESGVPGMPKHFQTFLKHKRLNDDKYREWLAAYRKADKPVKVKPVMPVPKPKPKPAPKEYRPPNEQDILKQFKTYDPATKTAWEKLAQVNPHYHDGREYQSNCQRCVVAHELVWRGYNVEAMPRANDAIGSRGVVTWKFDNPAWWSHDKDVRVAETRSKLKGLIKSSFGEWGDGSRAILRVRWANSTSAHFLSMRRVGDEIILEDPQSKRGIDMGLLLKRISKAKYENWFMRVDNRELTDLVTLAVRNVE